MTIYHLNPMVFDPSIGHFLSFYVTCANPEPRTLGLASEIPEPRG